jgi:hypothetical protein
MSCLSPAQTAPAKDRDCPGSKVSGNTFWTFWELTRCDAKSAAIASTTASIASRTCSSRAVPVAIGWIWRPGYRPTTPAPADGPSSSSGSVAAPCAAKRAATISSASVSRRKHRRFVRSTPAMSRASELPAKRPPIAQDRPPPHFPVMLISQEAVGPEQSRTVAESASSDPRQAPVIEPAQVRDETWQRAG